MQRRISLGVVAVLVVVVLVWMWRRVGDGPARRGAAVVSTIDAGAARARESPPPPIAASRDAAAVVAAPAHGTLRLQARWGPGIGELGRKHDAESAPEAPMSLVAGKNGDTWILDQVNGRVQHFDAGGRAIGELRIASETTQDLALAANGDLVLLDRLGQSQVSIYDAAGDVVAQQAVVGGAIAEGGQVTGVFADDSGVYLEREHTDVVRVADATGQPDPSRPTAPGRPTRDGSAFLRAAIAARGSTAVSVTVFAADGTTRWQRVVAFPRGVLYLVLLDSDRAGHVLLGAQIADAGGPPRYAMTNVATVVFRLALADGSDAGALVLPAYTGAEEMFRELTVTDEGAVVQMLPSEDGVTVTTYDFP